MIYFLSILAALILLNIVLMKYNHMITFFYVLAVLIIINLLLLVMSVEGAEDPQKK